MHPNRQPNKWACIDIFNPAELHTPWGCLLFVPFILVLQHCTTVIMPNSVQTSCYYCLCDLWLALCYHLSGWRGLMVHHRTHSWEVAGSTITWSITSNTEPIVNLLCAQANSASFPQCNGKWVVAYLVWAMGWRSSVTGDCKVLLFFLSLTRVCSAVRNDLCVTLALCEENVTILLFITVYLHVFVIVWRLRGNISRTALRWIVWHSVHSQQHTYVSSFYGSNRLGLSHWDSYTCLLYTSPSPRD